MSEKDWVLMNDKFYSGFINIVSKVVGVDSPLDSEQGFHNKPSFKNGVLWVASTLSDNYKGQWVVANCEKSNNQFMLLRTNEVVVIKQESYYKEIEDAEIRVDGRVFGLIASLITLKSLHLIAAQSRRLYTNEYYDAAEAIKSDFSLAVNHLLYGDGRENITQEEFREVESMNVFVTEFCSSNIQA